MGGVVGGCIFGVGVSVIWWMVASLSDILILVAECGSVWEEGNHECRFTYAVAVCFT